MEYFVENHASKRKVKVQPILKESRFYRYEAKTVLVEALEDWPEENARLGNRLWITRGRVQSF